MCGSGSEIRVTVAEHCFPVTHRASPREPAEDAFESVANMRMQCVMRKRTFPSCFVRQPSASVNTAAARDTVQYATVASWMCIMGELVDQ